MGRRSLSKGRQTVVPPPPCAFSEHESQVNEVSARIEELLREIHLADEEDSAQPASLFPYSEREADDGEKEEEEKEEDEENEQDGTSSGSDLDIYVRMPPRERPRLAQRRLEKLLGRLNIDERDMALGEVCEWLQDRVSFARQDLNRLGRLDRECADRGAETAHAARAVKEDLQKRGRDTVGTVRVFCQALSNMEASKRKSRAPRSQKSRRVSVSRTNSNANQEHAPMTEEQLAAAIEELRERLQWNEDEARTELRELRNTERVRKPSDEDEDAEYNGDIYAEQERWLLYLKEAISENETRARLVREVNDNLHGKVMMGEHGEVIPLSQEAMRISKQLQEEVNNTVLPELLAQREADHGEELKLPDEERLNKITDEIKYMDRRIGLLDGLMARLGDESVLEDDVASQLREMDTGELPQSTLLHDCLQALEEDENELEDASDEAEEPPTSEAEPEQGNLSERPRLSKLATQEHDMRSQMQASLQDCAKVHEKIVEATESCKHLQRRLKALEQEDSAVMRVLDILEEHKTLFTGAQAAVRHLPPPAAEKAPEPSPPGSPPKAPAASAAAGDAKDKPAAPKKKTLVSVVAAFRRGSITAKAPLPVGRPPEDMSWLPPFFADEDNTYPAPVLAEQADVLKAMVEEERRLMLECHDLEAALSQKVAELQELSRTKHGGVTVHAAGLLTESVKAGHEAIEGFTRSLRELSEVTTKAPARSEPSLTLQERRQVVQETLAKMEAEANEGNAETDDAGSALTQAQAAVQEALHLGGLNARLLKRLDIDQTEVRNRRQGWARRNASPLRDMDKSAQKHQAAESRRVRQHTRTLAAMRKEIAMAVIQQQKLAAKEAGNAVPGAGAHREGSVDEAAVVGDQSREASRNYSVDETVEDVDAANLQRRKSFEKAVAQHAADVERKQSKPT